MSRPAHFLRPALAVGAGVVLAIEGRPEPLATVAELAVDSTSRRRGLLDRDQIPHETALVIAPTSAVHTFGMRFPIDIIFAARDGRVLKVRPAVPRSRIAFAFRAFAVVEMAAGSAARVGLRKGDRLVVRTGPAAESNA